MSLYLMENEIIKDNIKYLYSDTRIYYYKWGSFSIGVSLPLKTSTETCMKSSEIVRTDDVSIEKQDKTKVKS